MLVADLNSQLYFANITNGKFLNRIQGTNIFTSMCGLVFPKGHKLFSIFDEKFQRMFNYGIIDYELKDIWNFLDRKRFFTYDNSPEVLTLKHLEAGFVVWLVAVSFACIAFACEWLVKLIEYLIIRLILNALYLDRKGSLTLKQN